jgi:phospholipid/cholesterol/gamma-HCH transport system ATP-binding protein
MNGGLVLVEQLDLAHQEGKTSVSQYEIECREVSKAFEDVLLLHSVNLQVAKGETLVLIGPSGQGKSVFLKMLCGLLPPTQGEVLHQGDNLYQISEKQRNLKMQVIGMLFQKNALFDSLTCAENIAFPLREITNLSESEIGDKITHFLEAVELPHARDLYPHEISGGMQKRLGIARALALDPKLIFYDDPTAGLDPITSRTIIDLILHLSEQNNSTVVAITNDMGRAYQMADRIGMIVDRELVITGNVEQTKTHQDPRVHQFITGALEGPLTEAR